LILNLYGSILRPAVDGEDTVIRLRPLVFENPSGDGTSHQLGLWLSYHANQTVIIIQGFSQL